MRAQLRVVIAVARERTLARIELAYLAFNAAEYGTWTAILVYAYAIGGPATAGLAALVQLVPSAVVAPLAANAGDRFRWHRVLLAGYVVLALAFGATAGAMDAALPMPVVLAFAALASAAVTVIRPVQAVILPAITHSPADLTAANAVSSLAESLGAFLGPLAAGLLLLGSGSAEVFLAFAAVLVAAALLVARLPAEIDERRLAPASPRRIAAEALGGFEALASERRLLVVVLVLASSAIVVGTLDVLFVAVAVDLLHAGPSWAGFLGAAAGVGAIGGAFAAVTLVGRRRLTPAVAVSGLAYGLPIAVIAPLQSVATAAGPVRAQWRRSERQCCGRTDVAPAAGAGCGDGSGLRGAGGLDDARDGARLGCDRARHPGLRRPARPRRCRAHRPGCARRGLARARSPRP
jgi:MFS family permease